jgi:hypothetical protein
MKNKKSTQYASRALHHLLKLTVWMVILFALMYITGTLAITPKAFLGYRGIVLLVAVVAISLAYPAYGFSNVVVYASAKRDRALIQQAMEMSGYQQVGATEEGADIYRAKSPLKRLLSAGDDAITVTPVGEDNIEIAGLRKEVEGVRFRIVGLMNSTK